MLKATAMNNNYFYPEVHRKSKEGIVGVIPLTMPLGSVLRANASEGAVCLLVASLHSGRA
jgi:hypothetical protein